MEDKNLYKIMKTKTINHILKEYKNLFKALEDYDKTRELPSQRKRIDITLSVRTINKLRELKERTGKSVSEIIEEKVEKC